MRGSSVPHRIIGSILLISAVLALNEAFLNGSRSLRIAWSGLVTVLAVLFVLALLFREQVKRIPGWLADLAEDSQYRQHLIVGLLLILGGFVEFTHAKGWTTALIWHYFWPAVLVVVGVMFASYRLLGGTLILAGLLAAGHAFWRSLSWAYLWPLVLLVAAILLVSSREPET